jgi:hypothetical protein
MLKFILALTNFIGYNNMAKHAYAYNIHTIHLTAGDSLRVTANIAFFSVLYAMAGGFLSFILYYLFDTYDPPNAVEWESKGLTFQCADIALEIMIIGLVAFWLVYFINVSTPIIPVRKGLEDFVDSYTSGLFFMFAIFMFLQDFTNKMKYVFNAMLGNSFDRIFPAEGSIIDGSLRYSEKQKAGKYT